MTRSIGDAMVGAGFGALFERQIEQESGFDPDVVSGRRRSSAGAEGIAQLMPQYYPRVNRTDPEASLRAGADSMRHYLAAFDGDVRKALASYNAGMGRVQQLVRTHGAEWERGLPEETKHYLAAIVGSARDTLQPGGRVESAVFGGPGPGGVLSAPLAEVRWRRAEGALLALGGQGGSTVRAPADGVIGGAERSAAGWTVTLDHGNGWQTRLAGLQALATAAGAHVSRGAELGQLGGDASSEAVLRLGVSLEGRALDPRLYLLGG